MEIEALERRMFLDQEAIKNIENVLLWLSIIGGIIGVGSTILRFIVETTRKLNG